MSIANSLALGLPVVTSNVGDSAEAVRASGGGLVLVDAAPNSVANAILSILRDHERWEEMSSKGKQYARHNLHPHLFINKHIEIYNMLSH